MTWQWVSLAALVLVALVLAIAILALRTRTRRELASAHDAAAALRERLDRLEQERRGPAPAASGATVEYRITELGDAAEGTPPEGEPARLERRMFADVLLRESVIRLGSLGYGVRRALSAESRNRIRFEVRREAKRARKQRRADQREAYRDWQARRRGQVADDELRDTA